MAQLKKPTNVTFDLWTYCLGDKRKSKYIKRGIRNRRNRQEHKRTNHYKLLGKGHNINGTYFDGKDLRFYLDFRPTSHMKKVLQELNIKRGIKN